jgi:hypothetical protein
MKLLHLTESINITFSKESEEAQHRARSFVESKNGVLIPTIEAIHSSVTRNRTFYSPTKLRGKADYTSKETNQIRPTGIFSWTKPFAKPMLLNHDIEVDPLGRVTRAEFKNKTSTGVPGIICYPEITDPEAALKVLDSRYKTVSVGSDTNAAICSICGKNMLDEWCDHRRGQMYEGKLCFWSIGDVWFAELSFVNRPSDEHAGVTEIPEVKESTGVSLGLLIQDLKENRLYDLTNDQVYAVSHEGLILIPHSEYMQEYFYIPFNTRFDEDNSFSDDVDAVTISVEVESITDDTEKGGTSMSKPNTNTETPTGVAEKEDEQVTVSGTEIASSSDKVMELETQIEGLKSQIASMLEQLQTLTGPIIEDEQTETSANKDQKDETQENTEIGVATLESVQAENTALVDQNAVLKAQILKFTAEKIADLKIELGDLNLNQRESEIEDLITRSEESLADALKDLQTRKAARSIVIEKVENPGLADNSQKGVLLDTPDTQERLTPVEKLTAPRVFKNLLTGQKN